MRFKENENRSSPYVFYRYYPRCCYFTVINCAMYGFVCNLDTKTETNKHKFNQIPPGICRCERYSSQILENYSIFTNFWSNEWNGNEKRTKEINFWTKKKSYKTIDYFVHITHPTHQFQPQKLLISKFSILNVTTGVSSSYIVFTT